MRGGVDKNGSWVGTHLGKDQSGLRLGEHERLDHSMTRRDLFEQTPDEVITLVDLWGRGYTRASIYNQRCEKELGVTAQK